MSGNDIDTDRTYPPLLTDKQREVLAAAFDGKSRKGLDLRRTVKKVFEDTINPGTLYPLLGRTVESGFLQEQPGVDARSNSYTITQSGKDVLEEDLQRLEGNIDYAKRKLAEYDDRQKSLNE